jgi:hypothetical protein
MASRLRQILTAEERHKLVTWKTIENGIFVLSGISCLLETVADEAEFARAVRVRIHRDLRRQAGVV